VLTVNRRLARHLMDDFDRLQLEQGRSTWPTPDIVPLSGWLERCWDSLVGLPDLPDLAAESGTMPLLLNPVQEQALWEQVIRAESVGSPFLDVASVAEKALQAYELWHAWLDANDQVDPANLFLDVDAQAFQTWMARFEARCTEQGWIVAARLPAWLTHQAIHLAMGSHVLLAGFERLAPALERLFDQLSRQGTMISCWQPPGQQSQTVRLDFPDQNSEIETAARWARHHLAANPEDRIGVIIPDLQRMRAQVVRIFTDVLHPEMFALTAAPERPLFNLSLGSPLAGYPLIQDMFLVLDGLRGSWALTDAGALLRSPCITGGESERWPRALLDQHLRDKGRPRLAVKQWQQMTGEPARGDHCPLLRQVLTRAMAMLPTPDRQTPSAWVETFSNWLAIWGWPGERTLTSREFQTWEAGRTLLATFATLDRIVGRISLPRALQQIRKLAQRRLYQPETPDAPIQILGILEATGEPFSALWLLGLAGEVWPAAPAPNPFLPLAWQRQRGLPRASAQGELDFARRLTERLLASAPRVVASHARMQEDLPQRLSPLIAHVPPVDIGFLDLGPGQPYWRSIQAAAEWETCPDHQGTPLQSNVQVAGGARVLKSQAECPFQAYAVYRLGATALPEVEPMVDARTRGTLVHRVLELFWRETPDLKNLAGLDDASLAERIRKAVVASVQQEAENRPEWFPDGLRRLEENRLTRLLTTWIKLERTRTRSFQVVLHEKSLQLDVGGLLLDLRPDRVDALADGRRVVLDYKTGEPKLSDWRVPRLREPQLPLYCLIQGENVAALAFAKVRPEKPAFLGLGAEQDLLPMQNSMETALRYHQVAGWPELLTSWREDLTRMAGEFLAGVACVSPLPGACDYCQLTPLCRIHEAGLHSDPDDPEPTFFAPPG
ncbi:MAG: PD-(D/E)XK nuclease family protein, partial [Magnetococcus sp. DMHC-1]